MSIMNRKSLGSAALGALFIGSLSAAPIAGAAENPFGMQSLSNGYTVADRHGGEGRCGEGRCGGATSDANKKAEGSCGGASGTDKKAEGNCGGAAGDKDKQSEGKCGEGRCGSR
jgi:uncharacterized low-complexity protein